MSAICFNVYHGNISNILLFFITKQCVMCMDADEISHHNISDVAAKSLSQQLNQVRLLNIYVCTSQMTQFMLTKHADCISYNYFNNEHLKDDPVLCERTVLFQVALN